VEDRQSCSTPIVMRALSEGFGYGQDCLGSKAFWLKSAERFWPQSRHLKWAGVKCPRLLVPVGEGAEAASGSCAVHSGLSLAQQPTQTAQAPRVPAAGH
jgi:hypothetical protein